jgi:hypothetical protein
MKTNAPLPASSGSNEDEEINIVENTIISRNLLGTDCVPLELTDTYRLRSGKWTKEEEQFSIIIIQHFQLGTLNVPDGTTLRQCLSVALNCDAMRISKKFAGPYSIGKQVFSSISRSHANYTELMKTSADDLRSSRSAWFRKLEEIERCIRRTRKRNREKFLDRKKECIISVVESADLELYCTAIDGLSSLKHVKHDINEDTVTNIIARNTDAEIPRVVNSMEKILKGDYSHISRSEFVGISRSIATEQSFA